MPPDVLEMRWWAKVYQFTRRQVAEDISLDDYEWFPVIEQAEARAAPIREKLAAKKG